MRSCETSTQSLTPISWPTYFCIAFGWANSLFAISYLGSVYCLAPARYHENNRLQTTLSYERAPFIRGAIIVEGSLSLVSNWVPFVAIGSHLYRRCIFRIMPATRMHMRSPRMAYEAVLYD